MISDSLFYSNSLNSDIYISIMIVVHTIVYTFTVLATVSIPNIYVYCSVSCIHYCTQCAVYIVYCTIYSLHCTVYNVSCALMY